MGRKIKAISFFGISFLVAELNSSSPSIFVGPSQEQCWCLLPCSSLLLVVPSKIKLVSYGLMLGGLFFWRVWFERNVKIFNGEDTSWEFFLFPLSVSLPSPFYSYLLAKIYTNCTPIGKASCKPLVWWVYLISRLLLYSRFLWYISISHYRKKKKKTFVLKSISKSLKRITLVNNLRRSGLRLSAYIII